MKNVLFSFLVVIWVMMLVPEHVNSQSILNKAKQKIKQRADTKVDKAMNDGLDKAENKKAKPAKKQIRAQKMNPPTPMKLRPGRR